MMEREKITTRAHGIDVSHHQEEYIYDKTWGQVDFAIVKIGMGYNTPYGGWDNFNRLWDRGVAQLPIRGIYFYQKSGYSWKKQADLVLEAMQRLSPSPHMLWLDIEKIGNIVDKTMLADSLRILDYWSGGLPEYYTIGDYTNKDVLNIVQTLGLKNYGQEWLNRFYAYPLWYAQYWWKYSPNKQPAMPPFHSSWKLWQYTDRGDSKKLVDGTYWRHYGSPDLNVFNGPIEDMKKWLKI